MIEAKMVVIQKECGKVQFSCEILERNHENPFGRMGYFHVDRET
jgi:hypothetical protein